MGGTDTKLNRLLSLAKKFGAEIEFDTRLNADSSIKSFTVNVYHEHDDSHQGVGQISSKILKYGKTSRRSLGQLTKLGSITSVVPTGRDDKGNVVDIRVLELGQSITQRENVSSTSQELHCMPLSLCRCIRLLLLTQQGTVTSGSVRI